MKGGEAFLPTPPPTPEGVGWWDWTSSFTRKQ